MSENLQINKTPQAPAAADQKSKSETFVDKVNDASVELKSPLPPRFQWRGTNYVTKDLTPAQIKALAEDKAFPHIVPKQP